MKTFIKNILFAIIILLSVFILGIISPTIVSSFIVLTTKATFEECVQTGLFWFVSILGWLCASVYVNDLYNQIHE